MIFSQYWYFTSYFGMYLFLPISNIGIANLSKGEFRLVVMSTIGVFIIWRYYKNPKEDVFHFKNGMYTIWLLTYYLTGAYIGKYNVNYTGIKKYIYCLIYLVIFIFAAVLFFKASRNEFYISIGNIKLGLPSILKNFISRKYDSLVKIIQSISACLFFMQINYNKYLAKIISFFGPFVFSVYIIHMNPFIERKVLYHIFDDVSRNISLIKVFWVIFYKSFKFFISCIIIDYLRHLLFTLLRIRKILIFLEAKIKILFNQ